jgi:hypothetical protein
LGLNSGSDITTGNNNIILGSVSCTGATSNTIILATGSIVRYLHDGANSNTTLTGNVLSNIYFSSSNVSYFLEPAATNKSLIVAGNVGIRTINPTYALEVNGSFAATTKSFDIPHPSVEGKRLVYGSLEGPENGVYVRGKLTEKEMGVIELPYYWKNLVSIDSITVNITPIGKHQKLYVDKITENCVVIKNDNLLDKKIECFYMIFAERKDVNKLVVEK